MAGEYGIAQGINQGLQYVNQGMQNSMTMDNTRLKVQQDAAKFDMYMKIGQTQQQQVDLQLQEAKLKLDEMNKQIAVRDTWDALAGYEQTKDASILNTVKSNPLMANVLQGKGITGFTNISDVSQEKLNQLGINDTILNDPSKRVVLATTTDGNIVPMDMMGLYATSGFLPKLGQQKLNNIAIQQSEAKANIESLKYKDMTDYLAAHPEASLADYTSHMKSRSGTDDTAEMKNLKFEADQRGVPVSQIIEEKRAAKLEQGTPSSIKTAKYNQGVVNTIKDESKVENLYDVDYTKLSKENKTKFDDMVKEDAKNIKPEERDSLMTLQAAADKLNVEDLKDTTGIVDATFGKLFDTLGMDLPDSQLVQSANYNLIKNSIVRAAMGTAVTGTELERMTAQLGTEFKSDKTVRIKMAETLDNLVAKYDSYKTIAPAFYARVMKDKVNNMQTVANYLRNPEKGKVTTGTTDTTSTPKNIYKAGDTVTNTKDNTKWKYLGGDINDKKNWKKVE